MLTKIAILDVTRCSITIIIIIVIITMIITIILTMFIFVFIITIFFFYITILLLLLFFIFGDLGVAELRRPCGGRSNSNIADDNCPLMDDLPIVAVDNLNFL